MAVFLGWVIRCVRVRRWQSTFGWVTQICESERRAVFLGWVIWCVSEKMVVYLWMGDAVL